MAMKLTLSLGKRSTFTIGVLLVVLAGPATYGCGPWFDEAVFIPGGAPQTSQSDFASGKLGIVLPTMRRSYLVVGYRYLNGMKLNAQEQRDAIDVWNRNMDPTPVPFNDQHAALDSWLKVRAKVQGASQIQEAEVYAPVVADQPYEVFLNCQDDAFKTAERTLDALGQKYGAASAEVKQWLAAQDQVFANCEGGTRLVPAPLESSDPVLRANRNYQIAAALLYQRRFDEAAAAFEAVSKDTASPWAPYGDYLAGRAILRKATLNTSADGKPDMAGLRAAQQRLEEAAHAPESGALRPAAQRLVNFVRFRTEPEKRVVELEQELLKVEPSPDFKQHLWDYVLLLSQGEQAQDLGDWIKTFYTEQTDEYPMGEPRSSQRDDAKHAQQRWQESHSVAWLIAALALADPKDSDLVDLLKAANQVPETSPGYISVRYYALRLMATGKEKDVARKELDSWLKRPEGELAHGTRNLFNDQRQKLSMNLKDFLSHAAEQPAKIGWDAGAGDLAPDSDVGLPERAKKDLDRPFFNDYSAQVLSHHMPLDLLVESARAKTLPVQLRKELVRSTWTRAIVLGKLAVADQLQPVIAELDNPLWKSMEPLRSAKTPEERRFVAALVTLQNPGLSPYVRTGLLRTETLGKIDIYRDNWWCETPNDGSPQFRATPDSDLAAPPQFISEAEVTKSDHEKSRLANAEVAPNFLVAEVLDYAKSHLDDKRVPLALHLAVRSTRYGCTDSETTGWSAKAFRLLHRRYPTSEWAMKTKYYF